MLQKFPARGAWVRLSVLGLLLAMSCGGGSCGGASGCGGCGDGSYQYPSDDPSRPDAIIQDEIARVRVNQDFLDFVKPQLPTLIAQQLGNMGSGMYVDVNNILHIPLPNIQAFDIGIAGAALERSEALLYLDDLDNALDVRFEEPNGVRLVMDGIRLGIDATIIEDVVGSDSACPVLGDLRPDPSRGHDPNDPPHAAELTVEALIDPGVGPSPDYALDVRVNVGNVSIDDLDLEAAGSSVYCQEPECRDCAVSIGGTCLDPGGRCVECRAFCGGVTNVVVDVATGLIDLIRPLINRILTPVVEGLLGDALNDLNGSSAKLETQADLAALSGLDALRNANPLGLFVAPTPGRFPVNDRGTGTGMEITVNGGAEGEIADCVGAIDPFVPNQGPVPTPPGTDSSTRAYHLFATFASSYINQSLYALHRNGTLCIRLGTEDVRNLTGGAFTLNASLLSILASDISELATDTAPVIIELKPENPAFVDLGTGERTGQDMDGNDLYDWLMKLTIEDIGIAFHVFMHDRYVRVFEVTSDVFVGLNVVVLPDNRLEAALGELRIDDFQEKFNEILPNADFAEVLPTLLDLALGAVLNQSLTFDVDITNAVSDALGGAPIFLRVNDIYRDGVQQDYLSMTLTFTSSGTGNLMVAADTQARLHDENDGLLEWDGERREATGRVQLAVQPGLLEYQVRVDGGLWRVPQAPTVDGRLLVEDAKLKIPGWHEVEVRARYQGDYLSLDPTPARFDVLVDPVAPRLATKMADDGLEVVVTDTLTEDPERLRLAVSRDGGKWELVPLLARGPNEAIAVLSWSELEGTSRLELQAADPRDNVSRMASVQVGPAQPIEAAPGEPEAASGCGCRSTDAPGSAAFGVLMLLGAVALRRRR